MQMKKKERSLLLIFLVGILLAGSVYLYGGKPGMQTAKASADDGTAKAEQQAKETVAENNKQVKVHVKGAVNQPGVYSLPSDSRVIDAIDAAGGAKADANVQQLNLASVVQDGAEVVVPSNDATDSNGATAGASAQADGKVNVNTASEAELDQLPGIGSIRAKAIVDYRTDHGQFYSIDDLKNVPGIGQKLLDEIRGHVKVN